MVATRENWAELLEPGLMEIFDNHTTKLPDYVGTLFDVKGSKKAAEHALGRGSIGMMKDWDATGKQVFYDEVAKGFPVTFRHKKYSNGLQIERDMIDDDQYSEIVDMTRDLSFSAYYTRQFHAASVFNGAFDTVRTPDGKALCATGHLLVPGSAQSFDNADTLDLTADNLEKVRNRMKLWKDDRGNIIPSMPDTILVPPALRKAALVIADTEGEPDTNHNNVNIWKGQINVMEWEMLENPLAWFVIDSSKIKRDLKWFDRRTPKLERDGKFDFDMEIAKWKTVGRWSYGAKTPLFIYGCVGTGA